LDICGSDEIEFEAQSLPGGVEDGGDFELVSGVQSVDLWLRFAGLLRDGTECGQGASGLHCSVDLGQLLDAGEDVFLVTDG